MNPKTCKSLRTIAFANNPSSIERVGRKWAIYEDKKKRMLVCLDPRAQYLAMKKLYGDLKGWYRITYLKEIKKDAKRIKKEFPRGSGSISKGLSSLFGNIINMSAPGEGVRKPTPFQTHA